MKNPSRPGYIRQGWSSVKTLEEFDFSFQPDLGENWCRNPSGCGILYQGLSGKIPCPFYEYSKTY